MKQIISEPAWGVLIVEDTEVGEMSFQCVCGGIAMYWRRIILTPEEIEEVRAGSFDAERMTQEVCKKTERVSGRLVEAFDLNDLARPSAP
jgi:hypothetical protein